MRKPKDTEGRLMRNQDLSGRKFGRLTVTSFAHSKNRNRIWNCVCDCGSLVKKSTACLNFGHTKSCGCLLVDAPTKHGFYKHKLYWVFREMIKRCYNVKNNEYKNYGGRGIEICQEWRDNPVKFYEWSLQNGYEEGLEIDRYPNNDWFYAPENCRWTTPKKNSNNTRRNTKLTFNGETLTIPEWAEKLKISVFTIRSRYYVLKMPIEKILSTENLSKCRKRTKRGSYKTRSPKSL